MRDFKENEQNRICSYTPCDSQPRSRPLWLCVGCLTPQQHGISRTDLLRIVYAAILRKKLQISFYLTHSQYIDTAPTSPSADPKTPGTWQGSHWSSNFKVTFMTWPRKSPWRKRELSPRSSTLEADAVTIRPMRQLRPLTATHNSNNNNNNNNNNNERISRALFHVKHAQLRWTGKNTKIENACI